jgi:peptide/nickel transport system substrate-binding protein/oligopeptide transport system substrate-binding protein
VFKLRGVKFHNGREMTAEDVRYSIERIRDPKNSLGAALRVRHRGARETRDAYTVRLKLAKPDAALLGMLATRASYVVPKEEVEKHGTLQKVAVGTGAFTLAEHVTGSHARFVRNDQYFEAGLPYLDGFTIQVIRTSRRAWPRCARASTSPGSRPRRSRSLPAVKRASSPPTRPRRATSTCG